MAEVTGPISTLPGRRHDFPDGTMCDEHPDRPAVARIQGETDSFGCEMYDMCSECLAKHREEMRKPDLGKCDWCDARDVARVPARDYEEGMNGPVYYVCAACKKRQSDRLDAELSRYGDYDYDDRDYDDDPDRPTLITTEGGGENG
jgi:hypothetical protein